MTRTREMYDAGALRERVKLMRLSEGVSPGGAVSHAADQEIAEVWAAVDELSGRELFASMQTANEAEIRVVIRYRSDIKESDYLIWQGTEFDITSIAKRGNRQRTEILAKRRRVKSG